MAKREKRPETVVHFLPVAGKKTKLEDLPKALCGWDPSHGLDGPNDQWTARLFSVTCLSCIFAKLDALKLDADGKVVGYDPNVRSPSTPLSSPDARAAFDLVCQRLDSLQARIDALHAHVESTSRRERVGVCESAKPLVATASGCLHAAVREIDLVLAGLTSPTRLDSISAFVELALDHVRGAMEKERIPVGAGVKMQGDAPEEAFFLHLIDVTWNEANEDQSVPGTEWAKRILTRARETFGKTR